MSINAICSRVAGLDVHKKIIVITVVIQNNEGALEEETKQFGTLPQQLKEMATWLSSLNIEMAVMESTGVYWKSVYQILEKHGIYSSVVNAQHVKNVPGRKTDVTDSQWLAYLARCGLLKASFVPGEPLRQLRSLTRYRTKVQRMIAQEKNRLNKTLDMAGISLSAVLSDIWGISGQILIKGLIEGDDKEQLLSQMKGAVKKKTRELMEILSQPLTPIDLFLIKQIFEHIQFMEKTLGELDQSILKALAPYEDYWKLLQTIPGIDKVSAAAIIAECGIDMKRFGNLKQFCAWTALCPGNNESAGKRKSGKMRKGNNFLKALLCEAANAASKTNSQFKEKYKALVIRRGHKRSIMAIAHKLVRCIYSLFMHKKHYRDPGIDYQKLVVDKNASRWIRSLIQYGYAAL